MKWLELIAEQHDEWILMAKKMGAKSYSEDIVQEAYIKIHLYTDPNKIIKNGKVSKGYMFFVIRSIYLDYVINKNKIRRNILIHQGMEHLGLGVDHDAVNQAVTRLTAVHHGRKLQPGD